MTVLAVAEHRRGDLRAVSHELLSAGRDVTDGTDRALHAAVVGGPVDRFADRLNREGVDTVHTIADGDRFNHDVYTQALAHLTESMGADLVLAPHTATGLDYAPALALRTDRPLVTAAVDIAVDDGLSVTREPPGSDLTETVAVDGGRAVVAVRPGQWPALEAPGEATVAPFGADIDDAAVRSTVTGIEELDADVDLADADVVVAVGRGIGSEANLDALEALADAIGATVAGSGPPVKRGWLPADRLVGQSGAVVAPDVYLAVGISGSVQHVAGMADSGTVVAINADPDAPIFDLADYGIVGDLFEVVPALTAAFSD